MPKLYEIPNGSTVVAECSDGSTWLTFHRIDGMYSVCTTERGALAHLYACSDMRLRDDGKYELEGGESE